MASWKWESAGGRSEKMATSVPAASWARTSLTMNVSEYRGYRLSTYPARPGSRRDILPPLPVGPDARPRPGRHGCQQSGQSAGPVHVDPAADQRPGDGPAEPSPDGRGADLVRVEDVQHPQVAQPL